MQAMESLLSSPPIQPDKHSGTKAPMANGPHAYHVSHLDTIKLLCEHDKSSLHIDLQDKVQQADLLAFFSSDI